jgi:chromosome segregation ATPase
VSHASFLHYQRNSSLVVASQQSASASRFRHVSFRLAAHVAAQEARLAKQERLIAARRLAEYVSERRNNEVVRGLREKLSTYQEKGGELLAMLLEGFSGTMVPENSIPQGVVTPPASQDPSPRVSWDVSKQLPAAIMELCRQQVQSLLKECRQSRDAIVLLRDTEVELKKEAKNHEQKVARLQAQIVHAESDLGVAQSTHKTLIEEAKLTVGRIKSLEADVDRLQVDYRDLGEENDKLKKSVDTQKHTTRLLNEATEVAQVALDARRLAEAHLKEERSNLLRFKESDVVLRAELKTKTEQIQEFNAEKSRTKQKLQELLEAQNAFSVPAQSLGRQLEDEKSRTVGLIQTEAELKSQLEEYAETVQQLRYRIQDLEESLKVATTPMGASASATELADNKALLAEVEAANKRRVTDIIESNSNLREALVSAEKENDALREELRQSKDAAQKEAIRLESDQAEFNEFQKKRDSREAQLRHRISQLEVDLKSSEADRESMQVARDALEEELVGLKSRVTTLDSKLFEAQNVNSNKAAAEASSLSDLKSFREDASKRLQQYGDEVDAMKDAIREKANQIKELQITAAQVKRELALMTAKAQDLESQNQEKRVAIERLELEKGELLASITVDTEFVEENCQTEEDPLAALLEQQTSIVQEKERQIAGSQTRIASLESQVKNDRQRYEADLAKFIGEDEEFHILRCTNGKQVQRISELENNIQHRDQASMTFHRQFRELQGRLSKNTKTIELLKKDVQSRDEEIGQLKESNTALLNRRRLPVSRQSHQPKRVDGIQNRDFADQGTQFDGSLSPPATAIASNNGEDRSKPSRNATNVELLPASQGSGMSSAETRVASSHSSLSFFHFNRKNAMKMRSLPVNEMQLDGGENPPHSRKPGLLSQLRKHFHRERSRSRPASAF